MLQPFYVSIRQIEVACLMRLIYFLDRCKLRQLNAQSKNSPIARSCSFIKQKKRDILWKKNKEEQILMNNFDG